MFDVSDRRGYGRGDWTGVLADRRGWRLGEVYFAVGGGAVRVLVSGGF